MHPAKQCHRHHAFLAPCILGHLFLASLGLHVARAPSTRQHRPSLRSFGTAGLFSSQHVFRRFEHLYKPAKPGFADSFTRGILGEHAFDLSAGKHRAPHISHSSGRGGRQCTQQLESSFMMGLRGRSTRDGHSAKKFILLLQLRYLRHQPLQCMSRDIPFAGGMGFWYLAMSWRDKVRHRIGPNFLRRQACFAEAGGRPVHTSWTWRLCDILPRSSGRAPPTGRIRDVMIAGQWERLFACRGVWDCFCITPTVEFGF